MTWQIPVQPSPDATALAALKDQVRELSSSFDAELTRVLSRAIDHVQNVTNRQLLRATAIYERDYFPSDNRAERHWESWYEWERVQGKFLLPPSPLFNVTTVEYFDENNTLQTWDPAEYEVHTVDEPGWIRPVLDKTYPTVSRGVRVTYEVGYTDWATSDPHLRDAILMYAETIYRKTDWGDTLQNAIQNASVGDEFIAYP